MKQRDLNGHQTPEGFLLQFQTRSSSDVTVRMPDDVLASLKKIATTHDMSIEALIKFYIGQGLRQDLAKNFADHVIDTTGQVLSRHLASEAEVSAILQEIRAEAIA